MPDKSTVQKLMMKPNQRIRLLNPPVNITALLGSLPEGTSLLDDAAGPGGLLPADVIVLFANGKVDIETLLPGLRTALTPGGILWVAYHKGTSPVKTDINRDSINAYAHTIGMQGVAMVSIDADWSALRLKLLD